MRYFLFSCYFLFGPNILLSTRFSNICKLCTLLKVTDQAVDLYGLPDAHCLHVKIHCTESIVPSRVGQQDELVVMIHEHYGSCNINSRQWRLCHATSHSEAESHKAACFGDELSVL
jgi:hypothetical protein